MTRGSIFLLVLAVSLAACDASPPPGLPNATPSPKPNVIFILADTLRADRLGSYGHAGGLSPALDAIAREGVTFEQVLAQAPWTQPSIASLFAACYPGVHRVLSYKVAFEGAYLKKATVSVFDDRFITLAETLRAAGYETAAIVTNIFITGEFGFDQGFDHFDTSFASNTTPGSKVNAAALAWLDRRDTAKPLFLYLHYMDVHGPYDARPDFLAPLLDRVERMESRRRLSRDEYARLNYLARPPSQQRDSAQHERLRGYYEYWVARYEAGVREFDHHLGRLRESLEERGLWEEALVVVTADHGEALLDHGLWDHGLSVHHAELHVPLIVRWPRGSPVGPPPGTRVAGVARLIDVMPTLLDELRLPVPEGVQGRSLRARIRDGEPGGDAGALAEAVKLGAEHKAWYQGAWKLVRRVDSPAANGGQRLHEIASDPSEQRDRAGERAAELAALSAALDAQLAENGALARGSRERQRELGDDQAKRLRALGYLEESPPAEPTPAGEVP